MTSSVAETRHGPLPYLAQLHPDRASRPALLYVGGLAPIALLRPPQVRGYDLVAAPLVGLGTHGLASIPARRFHEVYEDLIRVALPGRVVVACGGSTGMIPVLGMRAPEIRVKAAIDPALSTNWALVRAIRGLFERGASQDYYFDLFGVRSDSVEGRDYGDLLEGLDVPLHVVFAAEPLDPPRDLKTLPGMTSVAEQERLRAHPLVRTYFTPEGTPHDWRATEGGRAIVGRALTAALTEAMKG